MKDYLERLDSECEKFARNNNVAYERVQALMQWVEWISRNKTIKDIRNLIK